MTGYWRWWEYETIEVFNNPQPCWEVSKEEMSVSETPSNSIDYILVPSIYSIFFATAMFISAIFVTASELNNTW